MATKTYEEFERIINIKIDATWDDLRKYAADTESDRGRVYNAVRSRLGMLDAYKAVLEMARYDWVEEQDGYIIETRPVGFTLDSVECIIKSRWARHVEGDYEDVGYINAMSDAMDTMKSLE